MITIEAIALATMALVFSYSFMDSARSHSRRSAWAAPANMTPVYRSVETPVAATATVIDASDRFAARRALASADELDEIDVIIKAA